MSYCQADWKSFLKILQESLDEVDNADPALMKELNRRLVTKQGEQQ